MTNEEKAKEIASKYERWNQEDDESFGAYNGAMEMAEWKDKQFKIQEQSLLWTVESILDRLCIEGEARAIAIKEFMDDLSYYKEEEL